MGSTHPSPRKSRRVTKACDFCHGRGIRCRTDPSNANRRCRSCIDYDEECTFDRPVKKRGGPVRRRNLSIANEIQCPGTTQKPRSQVVTPDESWIPAQIANQATIVDLVEIYFEVVYPMYVFRQ